MDDHSCLALFVLVVIAFNFRQADLMCRKKLELGQDWLKKASLNCYEIRIQVFFIIKPKVSIFVLKSFCTFEMIL